MLWNIIISIAVGALIGWIAGAIMRSRGSILRNIIIGIIGSAVGRFIAGLLGISASTVSLGSILISVGGACIVIAFARLITGRYNRTAR
jgi:uncharacterized membrane protein YeaQ/YmgE (transglycosylase-associated protein family)